MDGFGVSLKILTLDIETRPPLSYHWGLFNQNINIGQIKEPGGTMGFGAKWYGERKTVFYSDFHGGHEEMVHRAHELMTEADAIVHFNGTRFDIPHLNWEITKLELSPPAPHKNIDLLSVVRKNFRPDSTKLDFVAKQLDLGEKVKHTGFALWADCMAGDEKAWRLMRKYCLQDVMLTEKLYDRLLPWITTHPNQNLYVDGAIEGCPKCGSVRLEKRGFSATLTGKYQRFCCLDCGGWSRGKKAVETVDLRGAS